MSAEAEAAVVVTASLPADVKRPQVETLLGDVFKLMEYPAKLDFKDMPDGSLGVAVHFENGDELPGITPGKRSYLVDCVQFWLNKVVNRPNVPRRWVNLGVNAFPEPRVPGQPQQLPESDAPPAPSAPSAPRGAKPVAKAQGESKKPDAPAAKKPEAAARPQHARRDGHVDERTLKPAADPRFSAAGKLLAEKSAKLGRLYAVMGLTADQRSLMLGAADEVKAVKAKSEGDGHWRRLVLVPEKLTVISRKQVMPDYDDEGDEDE